MRDTPCFATRPALEVAGDDPLDLGTINERLFGAVFPGVNNVVRYIRVYSALCWMVANIDKHLRAQDGRITGADAQRLADEAMQKIQLAVLWVNKDRGHTQLGGINREFPSDDRTIELVFRTFSSRASLMEAVAYRPSITNGLGFLEAGDGDSFHCTDAGAALAEAFERHAADSNGYRWLVDVTRVTARRSKVMQLVDALDVGEATSPERDAFLKQFFPLQVEDKDDALQLNRWFALHLVLRSVDLICYTRPDASGATLDDIRACMAQGGFARRLLDLTGLDEVQACWAVVQLRVLHRLALDTLFGVVERWLSNHEDGSSIIGIDQCAQAVADAGIAAFEDGGASSVAELMEDLRAEQGKYSTLYEAAVRSPTNEAVSLVKQIDAIYSDGFDFDDDGASQAVAYSLLALIFVAVETANFAKDETIRSALARDDDNVAMTELVKLVERFRESPPREFVAYIVKHWVILRHFHVVAQRTRPGDTKNRFRFMVGDRGIQRFDPSFRVLNPNLTEDRLRHILLLLTQCHLLAMNGEDGTWRLTARGRARMEKGPKT